MPGVDVSRANFIAVVGRVWKNQIFGLFSGDSHIGQVRVIPNIREVLP